MATPEDIAATHAEFQEKVATLNTALAEFEPAKATYLEKKQAVVDAIAAVDDVDNRLEQMTTEYEPPEPPAQA